jgi:hypothetical protein
LYEAGSAESCRIFHLPTSIFLSGQWRARLGRGAIALFRMPTPSACLDGHQVRTTKSGSKISRMRLGAGGFAPFVRACRLGIKNQAGAKPEAAYLHREKRDFSIGDKEKRPKGMGQIKWKSSLV